MLLFDRNLGHALLRPERRRRPAALAAPVLVLRPPRGLHPGPAGLRDHLGGRPGLLAQADLRLPVRRRLGRRDRLPVADGLGAPHVHGRHGLDGRRVLRRRRAWSSRSRPAIKIFTWLATMWGGRIRLTTAMLYALAFIVQFTIGGLSGVHFATVPIDWQTHDTYYVVAHFHYVLVGGTLFAILAGTYYWFPKMTGRLLDERLGRWHFWLMVVGFNLTFFPMHILGLMGDAAPRLHLPRPARLGRAELRPDHRRVPDGPGGRWCCCGTSGTPAAGPRAPVTTRGTRWTLEWATSSPPPRAQLRGAAADRQRIGRSGICSTPSPAASEPSQRRAAGVELAARRSSAWPPSSSPRRPSSAP